MSCPYFKEGYFGICVAPEAVHVASIAEMETFCFRVTYEKCPNFADGDGPGEARGVAPGGSRQDLSRIAGWVAMAG
ncbi:MAG: hypothetical protein M1497_05795 [Nitrospirae bacterium]|nr:hypothetical protein [Nitrospirota bacterium]